MPTLPPPAHVIALCGGRRDRALLRPYRCESLVRLSYPGDQPSGERLLLIFLTDFPCHARAARRARGAERERALAGASGGASGPCRPGLTQEKKV
jgi:hypothetical protein